MENLYFINKYKTKADHALHTVIVTQYGPESRSQNISEKKKTKQTEIVPTKSHFCFETSQ